MKAKYILLNHFSQRYPKIPKLLTKQEADEDGYCPKIALAADLMQLPLKDFDRVARYSTAIDFLFEEEAKEEEPDEEEAIINDGTEAKKATSGKVKPEKVKKAKENKGQMNANNGNAQSSKKRPAEATPDRGTRQIKRIKSGQEAPTPS